MNGAGKTTQLQIITGALQPDSGAVVKEKANMKISYLTQEFDVEPTRTVRVCLLGSAPVKHFLEEFFFTFCTESHNPLSLACSVVCHHSQYKVSCGCAGGAWHHAIHCVPNSVAVFCRRNSCRHTQSR